MTKLIHSFYGQTNPELCTNTVRNHYQTLKSVWKNKYPEYFEL